MANELDRPPVSVGREERAAAAAEILAPIAVAAGTGAITSGPIGALVGVAGASLERALNFLIRRVGTVEDEAVRTSGLTKERLVEALLSDEDRFTVAQSIFNAAQVTAIEEKLRMFGRLLAHAATDARVDIDEKLIYAHTLEELESPHLLVLEYLHRAKEGDPSIPTHPDFEDSVQVSEIARALPGVWIYNESVLARLRNNSLIQDPRAGTIAGMENPASLVMLSENGTNFVRLLQVSAQ